MKKERGITLVGLIIFLVVIGIALPPLLMIAYNSVENSVNNEMMLNSTSLAAEKMDDLKTLSFANLANTAGSFTATFSQYSFSVSVNYVSPPNYDTSVNPTQTNYKRVEVTVNNNTLPDINAHLVTVITNLE
jgi:type II secretory pathway pseudopilin PulG